MLRAIVAKIVFTPKVVCSIMSKIDVSSPREFPSLECCSVVDSRFSSRSEIVKDLNAVGLFDKIVQPNSLDEALDMLDSTEIDACILGPSVSFEKGTKFIQKGSKKIKSENCAFVVILNPEEEGEQKWQEVGAHGILRRPYSKHSFSEQIVRSVVKANVHSPWSKFLEEGQFGSVQASSTPDKKSGALRKSDLGNLLLAVIPELQTLIDGHKSGDFSLMLHGDVDDATHEEMSRLCERLLGGYDLNEKQRATMTRFLMSSLTRWFQDLVLSNEQRATQNLQMVLTAMINTIQKTEIPE